MSIRVDVEANASELRACFSGSLPPGAADASLGKVVDRTVVEDHTTGTTVVTTTYQREQD
jgi:hypothetical protein